MLQTLPPSASWAEKYIEVLENTKHVNPIEYLKRLGGTVDAKVETINQHESDWLCNAIDAIMSKYEKRFERLFGFYGPSFHNNTALRTIIRNQLEQDIIKKHRELFARN